MTKEEEEEKTEKPKQDKAKKADKKSPKQVNPLTRYFRETRGELRKVTWPTREESWRLTAIVLAVSTLMAAFLWVWDLIFSQSIHLLIRAIVGA
ncbi:MAG: preprotein translocase subunit SecE [Chloroflexi bacterium]|nr:preprotein translocase subunit SecE [Chloroflexota bacterium]MBK6713135.1 preprotein translocase subunit SecE [Chloroflexota bacterium]MBK7176758.1 preprotein translocase subunit SecE [Chloroflexota bacterium]MBK7918128.1 preprotein translocase subunit SecE [Chloroflexota bacterium]MBK8932330.1 preprotein translocase subunit SecE [Chloroflexota bacterium]